MLFGSGSLLCFVDQVPAILFTPICPHSLSFRPLILPEHVTLRVQIPFNSRSPAWVSFDGKDRKLLAPGDALICSMALWPVPMACQVDSTGDFLHSITEGLHWNKRKTQSFDGPNIGGWFNPYYLRGVSSFEDLGYHGHNHRETSQQKCGGVFLFLFMLSYCWL